MGGGNQKKRQGFHCKEDRGVICEDGELRGKGGPTPRVTHTHTGALN